MEKEPLVDWHTNILDCFEDINTCCYGFWCFPCLACTVSSRFGENTCLPLCDLCSLSVTALCGLPLFIPPPAVLSVRASIRNRYKIKGSLCKDIAISCFCEWCSWCQMHRELKHRREKPTVINVINTQPTLVAQPMPMMMMPTHPGVVMMS